MSKKLDEAYLEALDKIADLEAKLADMERCAENNKKVAELVSAEHNAKIENLEKQLAEKDKAIENWQTMYQSVMQSSHNGIEEDKRLREELKEKEKEIEQWKVMAERSSSMLDRFNYCGESTVYSTTRDQDKISFCIEKLTETKQRILQYLYNMYDDINIADKEDLDYILDYIFDNQIEELKKDMK